MISLLRQPDAVYGATKKISFRFEEQRLNDVEYLYDVSEKSAKNNGLFRKRPREASEVAVKGKSSENRADFEKFLKIVAHTDIKSENLK